MRERVLASSGKTFTDASTNTTSRIAQSHDQSHDQSHGGVGSKHFSAAAVQTECIQTSSGCVPSGCSVTTQTAPNSRAVGAQTETLAVDVRTDKQAGTASVCVQTESVQPCSSVEELHFGGSQASLRGRKRRGEGESHKRSLSEGTILVQQRRGREHGVSSLEGNRGAPSISQSAPGLSQVCVCVHMHVRTCVCMYICACVCMCLCMHS